jgi:MFS family permease
MRLFKRLLKRRILNSLKKKSLVVLLLVMFINAISYGIIIPLLYPLAAKFGLGAVGLSFLMLSFSLFQFLATPIIGRLSDFYGRKPLLLICLFGTSMSLLLMGLANSIFVLFFARILDGITGGNGSVAQAIIADITDKKDRVKYFGMMGAAFGFGFVFGPALGGIFAQYGSNVPFFLSSAMALFGVILGLIFLPETLVNKNSQVKIQLNKYFVSIWQALTRSKVSKFFWLILLAITAHAAFIIALQSNSFETFNMSSKQLGYLLTMVGVANIIMQGFVVKWLVKVFKKKRTLLRLSFILSCLLMFSAFFITDIKVFYLFNFLYVIAFSAQNPIIASLISENTLAEDQGGALGLNQSFMSLGQIFGPLLAGLIASRTLSGIYLLSAFVFFIGVLLTLKFKPKIKPLDLK